MCHPRPSSIPRCSGDQIKTDRRDARSLAKYFAAGLLTECLVLDQELESALSRSAPIKNLHRSKMQATHLLHARGKTDCPATIRLKKGKTQINKMLVNEQQWINAYISHSGDTLVYSETGEPAMLYDHRRERAWCHLDWFGFYRDFASIHNICGRTTKTSTLNLFGRASMVLYFLESLYAVVPVDCDIPRLYFFQAT